MKSLLLISFAILTTSLIGCLPLEGDLQQISFWTDQNLEAEGFNTLLINGDEIGVFEVSHSDPFCGALGLIEFTVRDSKNLVLTSQNDNGDAIEIGMINLYSPATGLKVKPLENTSISVNRGLDDECTLVYLDWWFKTNGSLTGQIAIVL